MTAHVSIADMRALLDDEIEALEVQQRPARYDGNERRPAQELSDAENARLATLRGLRSMVDQAAGNLVFLQQFAKTASGEGRTR